MNNEIQQFARNSLKRKLELCTEAEQLFFKRLYSFKDLSLSMGEVVDNMPAENLDWAMEQVQRTLDKKVKKDE